MEKTLPPRLAFIEGLLCGSLCVGVCLVLMLLELRACWEWSSVHQ